MYSHGFSHVRAHGERVRERVSSLAAFLIKAPILMSLSNHHSLLKVPSSNIFTLVVRASTYVFGGHKCSGTNSVQYLEKWKNSPWNHLKLQYSGLFGKFGTAPNFGPFKASLSHHPFLLFLPLYYLWSSFSSCESFISLSSTPPTPPPRCPPLPDLSLLTLALSSL